MGKIVKLKKKKSLKIERMKELMELSEGEKGLNDDEKTEFSKIKGEVKAINEEIENLEFIEENKVKDLINDDEKKSSNENKAKAEVKASTIKIEKGFHAASYLRCLAAAKHHGISAVDFAKKAYGENHPVVKTLVTGSGAGANIIPDPIANEMIELLRNNTVVRKMSPAYLKMSTGSMKIPRKTGSTAASYVGENTALNATDMSTSQLAIDLKKLMAVTGVSKELLSDSVFNVDALIRDDLVEAIVSAEDSQMLRGTGSATAPDSLLDFATDNSQVGSAANLATPTIAQVETELKVLFNFLKSNNIPMAGAYFLMAGRVETYLTFLRDANGNKAFPEMADGFIGKNPYMVTEAIPTNLGAGTDESELYLVQPKGLLLVDSNGMEIQSTDVGSYQVSGSLKSTFADDSVAFKITQRNDLGLRHLNAVAAIDTLKWGS